MRRRCASRLFGDWRSKTFSEILEENQSRNTTGVCQSCRPSFSEVAESTPEGIDVGLTRGSWRAVFMISVDLQRDSNSTGITLSRKFGLTAIQEKGLLGGVQEALAASSLTWLRGQI
jgi:hypothetical protein